MTRWKSLMDTQAMCQRWRGFFHLRAFRFDGFMTVNVSLCTSNPCIALTMAPVLKINPINYRQSKILLWRQRGESVDVH